MSGDPNKGLMSGVVIGGLILGGPNKGANFRGPKRGGPHTNLVTHRRWLAELRQRQ